MKIKLFTHCDLDGVGCAILAYLAFGEENVDVEYCGYKDVDESVMEFLHAGLHNHYDQIFITDISIREETVNYLLDRPDEYLLAPDIHDIKWRLFDHHATALGLNKYSWCEVRVNDTLSNYKASGASIFFKYLVDHECFIDFEPEQFNNLITFVKIVRDYDTWRWKELGEKGIVCKQLNDLLDIYGREDFIDYMIDSICADSSELFPHIFGTAQALLGQKQKDIDIYVSEKDKQLRVATDQFGKTFGWVFAERYFSELGNRLCELHPEIEYMAMIDISKGVVSFRSVKDDIDLGGEIAHSFGGGGHKKAAGSHFDADWVCKFVSWYVLNAKPAWSDIMPQYLGEPVKKED